MRTTHITSKEVCFNFEIKIYLQHYYNNYLSSSISFCSASLFLFHLISLFRYLVINLVVLMYISFNSYS